MKIALHYHNHKDKYLFCILSLVLVCSYASAMQYDTTTFKEFITIQLGVPFNAEQGDNQDPEFYESLAVALQNKTVYQLIGALRTSSLFIQDKAHTQLSAIKQVIYALIAKTLEQAKISMLDCLLFNQLEDPELLRYALQLLNSLREKIAETQSVTFSKLMLTLQMRLHVIQADTLPTPQAKWPLKDWILVDTPQQQSATKSKSKLTNLCTDLYNEVIDDMVRIDTANNSATPPVPLQQSPALTQEYTVTSLRELANHTIIMPNYHRAPKRDSKRDSEGASRIVNVQLIPHIIDLTDEQPQEAPVQDLTKQELLNIEEEKSKLYQELCAISIKQNALLQRSNTINTDIIKLNTRKQELQQKQALETSCRPNSP